MSTANDMLASNGDHGAACPICRRTAEPVRRSGSRLFADLIVPQVLGERRYLCRSCMIAFDLGWFGRCKKYWSQPLQTQESDQLQPPTQDQAQAEWHNIRPAKIETQSGASFLRTLQSERSEPAVLDLNLNPVGLRLRIEVDGAKFSRGLAGAVKLTRAAAREISRGVTNLCIKLADTPPPKNDSSSVGEGNDRD